MTSNSEQAADFLTQLALKRLDSAVQALKESRSMDPAAQIVQDFLGMPLGPSADAPPTRPGQLPAMSDSKRKFLDDVLGADLAQKVLAQKVLAQKEAQGYGYREKQAPTSLADMRQIREMQQAVQDFVEASSAVVSQSAGLSTQERRSAFARLLDELSRRLSEMPSTTEVEDEETEAEREAKARYPQMAPYLDDLKKLRSRLPE